MLPIWIYDVEVFKFDWIITFKNYETKELKTFHNDLSSLITFYKENIEYKAILVGYNNRHYDDWILLGLLHLCNPYLLNEWIITEKKNPWEFPQLRFKKNTIVSYDLIREIAIGEPISLKQLEAYYGYKIFENQISFNLDRPLTETELKSVIEYNIYDVEFTEVIFTRFKDKFISHYNLTEKYNLEPRALGNTAPQKTVQILHAQKPELYETFTYELPTKFSVQPIQF